MPLPAHQFLHPSCPIKPAWAVFDPEWYFRTYPAVRAACAGQPAPILFLYYLRAGARMGHSPSPLFDEIFYLARNPDIAELVKAGSYNSGFDHFCQHGHRGVSPHWLFDDALYASLHDDMTLENLDLHQCYGRYDHYLKSGQRKRRMAHFLFDAPFYRQSALDAGVAAAEIDALGPYTHFLYRLAGDELELPTSLYFEPSWYLAHNDGAKEVVKTGHFSGALHHYLCSLTSEYLDPVPEFSEPFYRQAYPDIAAAVRDGFYRSGYQQFVQHGAFELRRPRADINLMYYRDINECVRDDLNKGTIRDAFAHLRSVGLKKNLAFSPPMAVPMVTEPETRQQFMQRARHGSTVFARQKLDFSFTGAAKISVVTVLYNRFDLTMQALASLRANYPGAVELIVVDNDSTDETRFLSRYVVGARVLRNASNIGFLRAANKALPFVTAPALLYLNNDVELGYGAVAAALARLAKDESIGAVGGKIIRSNGQLQEAGCIIWNDGTTTGYLRDASPMAPEANFLRQVDFCSGVFLLCRADLVAQLGGFDEAFSPAYYEEADLCIRIGKAGYRVIYDPAVLVHHLEFGSAAHSEASMALMRRGRRIFKHKHAVYLQEKYSPIPANHLAARSIGAPKPRVLFIEDTVPLRRLGSGFVRSNDILHAIAATGAALEVFPINGVPHDEIAILSDMPETAEIFYDRDFMSLEEFLHERRQRYDVIWVCRTHNLGRILPALRSSGILFEDLPIILDTEAVASCRDAAKAALEPKRGFDFTAALRREFAHADICAQILAVSRQELGFLEALNLPVSLLGTSRAQEPQPAKFSERRGLLYVAGIHQDDSPNLDALHWYADEILPALNRLMGEAPVLNVVGHAAPGIDLSAFRGHPQIHLHGAVDDLAPFYNEARVFIAPARFAAGTPYKLYETASFGLPCVATSLLAEQLGWRDGEELLTGPMTNAEIFAAQIAALYRSEDLWLQLRNGALKRLMTENHTAKFQKSVKRILGAALAGSQSAARAGHDQNEFRAGAIWPQPVEGALTLIP